MFFSCEKIIKILFLSWQLTEFLGDIQSEMAAVDVLLFLREAVQRFPNLQATAIVHLLETIPSIKTSTYEFWLSTTFLHIPLKFFWFFVLSFFFFFLHFFVLFFGLDLSVHCFNSGFYVDHCGFWENTVAPRKTFRVPCMKSDRALDRCGF